MMSKSSFPSFLNSCIKVNLGQVKAQTQPALLMLAAQLWPRGLLFRCPKQEFREPKQCCSHPQEPICDLRETMIQGDVWIQILPWPYSRNMKCNLCLYSAAAQHVVACNLWQSCLLNTGTRIWASKRKKKIEASAYSNLVILTSPYHVVPLLFTVLHLSLVQNHLCYNSRNKKNLSCRCK